MEKKSTGEAVWWGFTIFWMIVWILVDYFVGKEGAFALGSGLAIGAYAQAQQNLYRIKKLEKNV